MRAAGDIGIDYSMARPSPRQTSLSGGKFVIRYSAGAGMAAAPATAAKLITPTEFHALLAAGLDVVANSEWYESRITERVAHPTQGDVELTGLEALFFTARADLGQSVPHDHPDLLQYVSMAARADAAADMALWRSCGYARGASIYVSWDTDPVQSKWAAVDAYLDTYNAGLAGYYHADCYAGTPYLKHAKAAGLIRYGWRPNAGSWSGDGLPYQPTTTSATARTGLVAKALAATPAHIWQTGNYWFSKQADENLVLRGPIGSHRDALEGSIVTPTPAPAPAPVPKPTPAPTTTPATPTTPTSPATQLDRVEQKLDQLLSYFKGAGDDGQPHSVEYIVAHVVNGHQYHSGKGVQWPPLAQK